MSISVYDPKEEAKYIIYLDVNNLYGHTISEFLPSSRFKWIESNEFDLNRYTKGCVLEADLKYPKELRELHK